VVEQGTHKPLVGGSNPPSATSASQALRLLGTAVLDGFRRLEVPDDAALVLAVSGGPDSMALLTGAALAVETDAAHWRLTVAHLDHRLRAESASDAEFVREAASRLQVPAAIDAVDVAELAGRRGLSLEEAGREARYAFLASVAGADGLMATAHTADDAAETVLINLLRGSGLAGARGIPARRGNIVRPLIAQRRTRLRDLLDVAGIGYRDDPSNADDAFLRNRIRAEAVPVLEGLRPGAVAAITRFGRLAADDDAFLDTLATAWLATHASADGIEWSETPPRALARRVLRLAIGDPAPSAERIEALLDAAEGPRGGLRLELGRGRVASVGHRRIRIE
jgi:tRNA(Ile)-lysidine synthase